MKRAIYFLILLLVSFSIYVVIVNKNSKQMTLKQKLLKAVYPVFMLISKKSAKGATILSNKEAMPRVTFYSLSDSLITGQPFNFEKLKGKKILLVNTASDCGYTGQYEDLEKLQQRYPDKLVILGFPSNDFNEQEKGDDKAIAQFCKINYGVSFPMMKKSAVTTSAGQNKVYQWLTNKDQNGWNSKAPSWNFSKYLVDENGKLTHFFAPSIEPMGKEIRHALNID